MLYKENAPSLKTLYIDGSSDLEEVVNNDIAEILNNTHLKNFLYEDYRNTHISDDSLIFDLTRNYNTIKWVTQPTKH